jgi:UPF0755 protein
MAVSSGSKVFALVVLSVIGGILFTLLRFDGSNDSAAATGAAVTVEIPRGVAADQVAEILVEAGVLDSALPFQARARVDERASQIQPGTYELRQGMSPGRILEILSAASTAPTFTVTIPEGLTVTQTLETIAEAGESPFTVDALREALAGVALPAWVPNDLPEDAEPFEGLLAPNTYDFRVDSDAQEVLTRLVAETDTRLQNVAVAEERMYDVLIIASLIEREVRVPEERPTVSSVIANRLAEDQRLQIDATVLYANGEAGTRVLNSDTSVDSPWNTYEVTGLPPTPIAAPGEAALEAAARPADTDYQFYVVCDFDTGQHAFAQTFEQHERNRARYREIRDAQTGSYCDEAA